MMMQGGKQVLFHDNQFTKKTIFVNNIGKLCGICLENANLQGKSI